MDQYNNQNSGGFCPQCGARLSQGAKFCPACGKQVAATQNPYQQPQNYQNTYSQQPVYQNQTPVYQNQAPVYQNQAPVYQNQQPVNVPRPGQQVSKGEFRRKYASDKFRKDIRNMAIVCYVLVAIQMVVAIGVVSASEAGIYVVIGLVNLALTLGMHLGKSKGCAIALLVISCLDCLISLIEFGSLSSYWWIFAAIFALKAFSSADKEYKSMIGG